MTLFSVRTRLADDFEMKKSISIMVHENGHEIPALTMMAGNPDFPLRDLNRLAEVIVAGLNDLPSPHRLNAGNCNIHFAQIENGKHLEGRYHLRYRTPDSGVTAEEGIVASINPSLPPYLFTSLHEKMGQVIRQTLDSVDMAMKHGKGLSPQSQPSPAL